MAGYSGTPLLKKLGIKPGSSMLVLGEPPEYWEWISPIPEGLIVNGTSRQGMDFIHFFVQQKKEFEKQFKAGKKKLKKEGMLWVSWPKKASKVDTDLDENIIREFGLKNGLVDVKVCAVSEIWSGLKFVVRLKDR